MAKSNFVNPKDRSNKIPKFETPAIDIFNKGANAQPNNERPISIVRPNKNKDQLVPMMDEPFTASKQGYGTKRITEEQQFEAPVTYLVLPKKFINTLTTTTPNILNKEYWLSHSVATTVTNFMGGQDGQHLYILGNGNTTVSSNPYIKTVTGANIVLLTDIMYHFIFMNNVWYQVGV